MRRRNRLLVEAQLFEELPRTRKRPGFSTELSFVGCSRCGIRATFDHPSIPPVDVTIQNAITKSVGWQDKDGARMRALYTSGMSMWKYINAVAQRELRIRIMLEKHVIMLFRPRLNGDIVHYLLTFI